MARIFKPSNIVIALMAILILIGIAMVLGYAYLPAYLQSRVLPKLAADAGLTELDLQVRRVGLFGAELYRIKLGKGSESGLVIDSVQIDYSPSDLMNKSVQVVTIRGIELNLEYKNGHLKLDESLNKALKIKPPAVNKDQTLIRLPFKRLALRNARVRLNVDGRVFTIPFELDLLPNEDSATSMTVDALLWPRDQRMQAIVKTNLEAGSAHIQMMAAAVQLNAFADLAEPIAGLHIGGTAKIDGSLDMTLAPFKISRARATIDWFGGQIQYQNMNLRPSLPTTADKSRWQVKVWTGNGTKWELSADPLVAELQAVIQLSGLEATAVPSASGFEFTGQATAEPLLLGRIPMLKLIKSPRIDGDIDATISRATGWTFRFEGTPTQPEIQLDADGNQLKARVGNLQISARGDTKQMAAEYKATLDSLRLRSKSITGRAAVLSLKGKTTASAAASTGPKTEISLSLANASGGTDKLKFSGAKVGYFGTLHTRESAGPQAYGSARFAATKLTAVETGAEIMNISGKLPLSWPPPKKAGKAGQFKMGSARFQKWKLANLSGIINQTRQGIDVRGNHKDALIPGLELSFNGKSQLIGRGSPVIDFSLTANRPKSAAPIDLGTLLPGGQGMVFSGLLEGKADLRVDAGGVNGSSSLNLKEGQLRASKENFQVSGIQLGLEMPGLPVLRSAPGQQLQFTRAVLGDIQIQNGRIFFQIESAPAVLLEKGQFDWSEGRVDMHSTRILLDREDYELTLFCDRLNLARLLEQFGAADAEGTGTVSGKIPIRYQNKKWSVADGFLFSSPGEGGQIRVQGTEILTAGIPKNTPQYMQLEIAREALKDYNFDWAKLTVSTKGEDMLLKLQLDGKPAKMLPFTFSKEIGSFARVEGQAEGSTFQGIRLDVNFKLPLNKILQYKSIIQMMRKK